MTEPCKNLNPSRQLSVQSSSDVPLKSFINRLLKWELDHPVDEDGEGRLVVKTSIFPGGGLG